MGAVILALAASLSWGGADFLGGLMSRRLPTLTVLFVSQVCALTLFGAFTVITGAGIPGDEEFLLYAVLAGLGEAVGLAAFYRGLAIGAMGVVAPISACSAIVPVAFGLATGDQLSGIEAVGIALAFVGVVAVGWEPGVEGDRGRFAAGVGLALFAALGLGGFFVAISYAVEHGDVASAVLVNRVALVILVGLAVLLSRKELRSAAPVIAPLAVIGVLDIGGSTLYAAATSHGLLAIVGAIAALYPIATVVLARVVLTERLVLAQRAGATLGLAGVAMIASVQ
jgi:drug/metabolite transporter (DMT)-like permease